MEKFKKYASKKIINFDEKFFGLSNNFKNYFFYKIFLKDPLDNNIENLEDKMHQYGQIYIFFSIEYIKFLKNQIEICFNFIENDVSSDKTNALKYSTQIQIYYAEIINLTMNFEKIKILNEAMRKEIEDLPSYNFYLTKTSEFLMGKIEDLQKCKFKP